MGGFGAASRSGSTGFLPEKVLGKVWEALVQSQVRFNRVPEKVPESQVQQGSGKVSGEGLGGFGAEPGQVQQRSGESSGEGLGGFGAEPGVRFNRVPVKVWEGLVQSQVKFNRVPEKVLEKVREALVQQGQVQQGRLWCRARSGSTGFRSLGGFGADPAGL